MDRESAAWNKGRVHYTSAPEEVVAAYADQFAKDTEEFLRTRAEEVVSGGMVVIIMPGIPHGMRQRRVPSGLLYDVMASSLLDMVNEVSTLKYPFHDNQNSRQKGQGKR